jgi:hypothetical protein
MSFLDRASDFLTANVVAAEREDARVASLRDGTPLGTLKADYLGALYKRRRTLLALQILDHANVGECEQRAGFRKTAATLSARMDKLERALDEAGIAIKKTRGPA